MERQPNLAGYLTTGLARLVEAGIDVDTAPD
jgi:hypothetical protein